jgi:hypothetical protein
MMPETFITMSTRDRTDIHHPTTGHPEPRGNFTIKTPQLSTIFAAISAI